MNLVMEFVLTSSLGVVMVMVVVVGCLCVCVFPVVKSMNMGTLETQRSAALPTTDH